jgi:ankyrin repeat protein
MSGPLPDHGVATSPELGAHALAAAFHAGDADAVRRLVARHAELRAYLDVPVGAFGATALIGAAERGDVAMVDALLDAGANVDARSDWWAGGFGVLDVCAPAMATHLVARGATVDVNAAARLGMLDRLTALLDEDPARVHARGGDGQTPLHVASSIDVARLLLDRGADIDALDVDHESTPAQYLVRAHPDVARLLVDRGCRTDLLLLVALGDLPRVRALLDADPACVATTVSDAWFPMRNPRAGGTIYHWTLARHASAHRIARDFGHRDVLALLFERSPAPLALAAACEVGDEALARRLHAEHPGIAAALTGAERRRLPDAAQAEDRDAVRLLLDAGWPVDARGQHAATALHWAAWHGDVEMIRLLLARGAPLEAREHDYGGTPLSWAIHASVHGWHPERGDHGEAVRVLLEAGAVRPETVGAASEGVRAVLLG